MCQLNTEPMTSHTAYLSVTGNIYKTSSSLRNKSLILVALNFSYLYIKEPKSLESSHFPALHNKWPCCLLLLDGDIFLCSARD